MQNSCWTNHEKRTELYADTVDYENLKMANDPINRFQIPLHSSDNTLLLPDKEKILKDNLNTFRHFSVLHMEWAMIN